jgi:hypothetical protein
MSTPRAGAAPGLVYTRPVLYLDLCTSQGPELHLDLAGQQEPVLLLDVSTLPGFSCTLDVSTLLRPVLFL